MTTVLDQVQRVRRLMYGGYRYHRNKLASNVDDSTTSIPFAYAQTGISRGSVLNIGVEKMHVWEWSNTSGVATVERGVEGSEAVAHQLNVATSSDIEVNPRFSGWDIACAVVDAVRALPDVLYPIRTSDIVVSAGQTVVNLDDVIEMPVNLVAVREHNSYSSATSDIHETFDMVPLFRGSSLVPDMTDTFGANGALRLGRAARQDGTIFVTYSYPFDVDVPVAELDDLVSDWGLATTMLDLPALGAAVALTQALEVERSDTTTQGEPRRAEEVPPMYASQMSESLNRRYLSRLREEAAKVVARRGIKS